MNKPRYQITAKKILKFYRERGVDVSGLISNIDRFYLHEGECGLLQWFPTVCGDSSFYQNLSRLPWYYLQAKSEFNLALPFIQDGPILEIGAGSGLFAEYLHDSNYIGIEINAEAALSAQQNGRNVILENYESYSDINSGNYNTVCSFQFLEHLPDPSTYFTSSYKLLSNGGTLITSVPCHDSFAGYFSAVLNAPPHHQTLWTDYCLTEYPKQYGFRCVELVHIPIEPQHANWFLESLLHASFITPKTNVSRTPESILPWFKTSIVLRILRLLGGKPSVPPQFSIRGHTVLAVHQKLPL